MATHHNIVWSIIIGFITSLEAFAKGEVGNAILLGILGATVSFFTNMAWKRIFRKKNTI